MPIRVEQPEETAREIKVIIGKEWQAINFGREIPRSEAIARARKILDSFEGIWTP